jgi:hypothetical protein
MRSMKCSSQFFFVKGFKDKNYVNLTLIAIFVISAKNMTDQYLFFFMDVHIPVYFWQCSF